MYDISRLRVNFQLDTHSMTVYIITRLARTRRLVSASLKPHKIVAGKGGGGTLQ
jgi:hypothetical protein